MSSIRLVRIRSAAVVAAIAAWSSYWHMVHVALYYGERSEVAYVLPLSVDGVLTIAAIVMAEDRQARQPVRPIAKVAFVIALSASIAANVAGAQPTLGGRLIAAWPAVALLLIVEMLVFIRAGSQSDTATRRLAGAKPGERSSPADSGAATPNIRPELHRNARPEPHPRFRPEPDGKFRAEHLPTTNPKRHRRPTSVTRRLAAELLATEPDLT